MLSNTNFNKTIRSSVTASKKDQSKPKDKREWKDDQRKQSKKNWVLG